MNEPITIDPAEHATVHIQIDGHDEEIHVNVGDQPYEPEMIVYGDEYEVSRGDVYDWNVRVPLLTDLDSKTEHSDE